MFHIGEIVRLVKKPDCYPSDMPGGYNWVPEMNHLLGSSARITDISEHETGNIYHLRWIYHSPMYGVTADCLEIETDIERIDAYLLE